MVTLSICRGCGGETAVRVSGGNPRQSLQLAGLGKITHFGPVDSAALFHLKQPKFRMLRLLGQIKFSKNNNTLMQASFFQKNTLSPVIRQGKSIQETDLLRTFLQSFKSPDVFPWGHSASALTCSHCLLHHFMFRLCPSCKTPLLK